MNAERYEFSWVGKRAARHEAYRPIAKTLRPQLDDSLNFDSTQNLYIEGDNLDALKLLQRSYLRRVKLIYIDPPYNTGHDFIYRDNFTMDAEDYEFQAELFDDDGNKNFRENPDTNPRFHSDWCSMIYSRLLIARNLLRDDGVIFISIDDNEQANLRKICDEVFGERNFVAQLIWEKKKKGAFLSNTVTNVKEYVIVYCKAMDSFGGLVGEINRSPETYPCINAINRRERRLIPRGISSKYKDKNYFLPAGTRISDTTMDIVYLTDLVIENGIVAKDFEVEGNWRYSQALMNQYALQGELYITKDLYLRRIVNEPRTKMLKDLLLRVGSDGAAEKTFTYDENLNNGGWGTNEDANEELHKIFGTQYAFDFAKPTRLIGKLIQAATDADSIVLDFFSGSATTAHAVMELNAADGGRRKFILVQLPEPCAENSEAFKAGYKNICEIGKERIRRAGKKFLGVDVGFRVLKIDSSNFKDIPSLSELTQEKLDALTENIKPDRSALDLLFGCLIEFGLDLSLPISEEIFDGAEIYKVGEEFTACFDENISLKIFEHIAEQKPSRAVFRDACFADDADKFNAYEIFKWKAPNTRLKVI